MKFRVQDKPYGWIVQRQERDGGTWRKSGNNDGPYSSKTSAQSRVRALRKLDADRPDDLAARIMASRRFCVI